MRDPLWHRPYLNYIWIQALIQRHLGYSIHVSVPEDYVDRLLRDWVQQRPDLDFSPVGIVTRLERVRSHLEAGLKQVFDRYDLSAADFVVIVSLRRAGARSVVETSSEWPRMNLEEAIRLPGGVAVGDREVGSDGLRRIEGHWQREEESA